MNLTTLLSENPSELDLAKRHLRNKDAYKLAGFLSEKDCRLEELRLAQNGIDDRGVGAIAAALKNNKKLKDLILSDNRITDDGAIYLASALLQNKTLESLTLSHNNGITSLGVLALADSLRRNKTLTYLSIKGVIIGPKAVRALALNIATAAANGRQLTIIANKELDERAINEQRAVVKLKYDKARAAVRAYLIVGKRGALPDKNMDTIRKAAHELWETRDEDVWLPGGPATKRARNNACIGCLVGTPLFHEQHDTTRGFCSPYCQLIHYHNLPDLRGMTPDQITQALLNHV